MNTKKFFKPVVMTTIAFAVGLFSAFAQEYTVKVMKNGVTVFETTTLAVNKMSFRDATLILGTPAAQNALVVHQQGSTPDVSILFRDIADSSIMMSGGSMSVTTLNGAIAVYPYGEITKLTFGTQSTGIRTAPADDIEVSAYWDAAGNLAVKCAAGIQSLSIFSIDGRMIAAEKYGATAETQCSLSVPNISAGIWLVRIETPQGMAVKKLLHIK